MDEEKFERMAEMMKGCCKDEESLANCCAMMRKMTRYPRKRDGGDEKRYPRNRIRKL